MIHDIVDLSKNRLDYSCCDNNFRKYVLFACCVLKLWIGRTGYHDETQTKLTLIYSSTCEATRSRWLGRMPHEGSEPPDGSLNWPPLRICALFSWEGSDGNNYHLKVNQ